MIVTDVDYPTGYPCPTWEYVFNQTGHPRRTQFDCGWARQRRRFNDFRSEISLTFEMNSATFDEWCNWVDKVGHEFFNIELDIYSGTPQNVVTRFTGPMQWSYTSHDTITATLPAESYGG